MPNVFDQFDQEPQTNAFDQFDAPASNVSAGNVDVPDGGQVSYAKPTDRSFGDIAEGVGEAALTAVTGVTSGAAGYIAGAIPDAIDQLTGNPDQKYRESLSQSLTNMPESEAGQEYVKSIGETLGVLPPVGLTGGVPPKFGTPMMPKGAFPKMKSPLAKKIMDEASGATQKSFKKKLEGDRLKPRIRGMVQAARKQGFDDGMTTVIANASPIDKRRMLQMVSKMEKGKADSLYQAKNRPADVAGDSLLRQIDFVKSNNKQAGRQLGRISETLKGKGVDVTEPISRFMDDLTDIGVKLDEDGAINFEGSLIEFSGPAKTLVSNTLTKLERNPSPDAFEAHEFKKFLDEDLKHGKKQEGGVSGKVERVFGDLRRGVNESISSEYKGYREANARFSDTVQALDSLQDAAGKKLDFFGPNADKATGTVLRRLMSNAQGRVTLMDAIENISSTSKKYGGSFEDDIMTQMLFADELDSVFGGGGRTSLRGEVKKAGVDTAVDVSQMTIPGAVALGVKEGAKKLRGVNEKNQIKAIKELLKSK